MAFAAIASGLYFSFGVTEPNHAMTGIWLTFSLFVFALGWPEIADSISFFGSSIKLREVKNAINELKQLAEVNARSTLDSIMLGSRWGGMPLENQLKIYQSIQKVLENLSFSTREIEDIQKNWHYWVGGDYVRAMLFTHNPHPAIPEDKRSEWREEIQPLQSKANDITPLQLKELFQKYNGYTDKVRSKIADYQYYIEHKSHRDLNDWEQNYEWFKPA